MYDAIGRHLPRSRCHSRQFGGSLSLSRRHLLQAAASAAAWITASARGMVLRAGETERAVSALPLEAVRLRPSPYLTAVESNRTYLLSLEPDRLLHNLSLIHISEPTRPY